MKAAITVKGLTKSFGDFTAVDQLSMSIPENIVYGFLGPNGSGKTTAIRMMCGLLDPTAGDIEVLGMKMPERAEKVRRQVGYMTQKFSMYGDLTVNQNLRFIGKIMGVTGKKLKTRLDELNSQFALKQFSHNLAGSLSGGQKRRLALAAATIHKPRLLLLDEPTSEVDPNTRRVFWDELFTMCQEGTTILVTTHLMDEAERCNHLAIIDQGIKVADGTPQGLKDDLPAKMIEVRGPDLPHIKSTLLGFKQVISTTQIGISLRVMLDEQVADARKWISAKLAGFPDLFVETALPTIEDVFVMATKEGNNKG